MKSTQINVLLMFLCSILWSNNTLFAGTSAADITEDLPLIQEHCQQTIHTLSRYWQTALQQIRPVMLYLLLCADEYRLPCARHILNLIHAEQQQASQNMDGEFNRPHPIAALNMHPEGHVNRS